jgi:hypothetical protein
MRHQVAEHCLSMLFLRSLIPSKLPPSCLAQRSIRRLRVDSESRTAITSGNHFLVLRLEDELAGFGVATARASLGLETQQPLSSREANCVRSS